MSSASPITCFFDSGLTNITIPRSVTSIGTGAFHPCPKLKAITVDAFNPVYSSVGGALLNKRQTRLIQVPGGLVGSYSVPHSVTNIGESALGEARLVKHLNGKIELLGGSDDDRREARQWCSLFLHEAAIACAA